MPSPREQPQSPSTTIPLTTMAGTAYNWARLEKLTAILGIEIDMYQLEERAKRIDASIRRRLSRQWETENETERQQKELKYIS